MNVFNETDSYELRSIQKLLKETDKAWQVKMIINKKEHKIWFPKSKCELEETSIRIPMWLGAKIDEQYR